MNPIKAFTIEKHIKECKEFYNRYLKDIKNRDTVLYDLKRAISIKESSPGETAMSRISNTYSVNEITIEEILKKHFPTELISIYKKKVSVTTDFSKSRLMKTHGAGLLTTLGAAFLDSMEDQNAQAKAQSIHELKLLKDAYFSLLHYGLHLEIKDRDPIKHKRFNLLIRYKLVPKTISEEFIVGVPYSHLDKIFIQYFKNRKSIQLNGKIIPHSKIAEVKITTTLLEDDEVNLFLKSKNIKSYTVEERKMNFLKACLDETNRYLPHPDEKIIQKKTDDFKETQIALVKFPKALSLFNEALEKRHDEKLRRNCLDDLRLCLETFLREKLKNKKSLENQVSSLGQYLKSKNEDNQVTDLLHKVIEFYTKFQNEKVKHNDTSKKSEVKFILGITSNLIEHLSVI